MPLRDTTGKSQQFLFSNRFLSFTKKEMATLKIAITFVTSMMALVTGRYLGAGHWHPEMCGMAAVRSAAIPDDIVPEMDVDTSGVLNCTEKMRLPCRIVQDVDLCGNLNYKSNSWPSAPVNLTALPYRYIDSKTGHIQQGVRITWKGPSDESLRSLKGFEITLLTLQGPETNLHQCRLVDLSRSSWKLPDDIFDQQVYEYRNFPDLTPRTCYLVVITSLPKPPMLEPKQIITTFTTF
ncbi:uncharacterized protein LOC141911242 [Tubulanus polymorphus]|uniref:uncharacterized protein LOC141911242 n=1 Tax=Tubulanus polymorphus TaxID=672921 RepID=UPI003DA3C96F